MFDRSQLSSPAAEMESSLRGGNDSEFKIESRSADRPPVSDCTLGDELQELRLA